MPKYTVPTSFAGMSVPTTIVGMLGVSVLHTKIVGMMYVISQSSTRMSKLIINFMVVPLNHTAQLPFYGAKFF